MPLPAVPGHTQARHAGVVLGGADDDVVLRDEFAQHVLMAAAVLQRHQVGVGTDDALVVVQGALAEHGLDEHDDQVHRLHALGGKHGVGVVHGAGTVRLLHGQALFGDFLDQGGVHVDHGDLILPAEVRAEKPAHGAGAPELRFS